MSRVQKSRIPFLTRVPQVCQPCLTPSAAQMCSRGGHYTKGRTVRGSNSCRYKYFALLQNVPTGCGGPPSLLFKRYRGFISVLKRPEREVGRFITSSVKVKNEWRYASTSNLKLSCCRHRQPYFAGVTNVHGSYVE